MTYSRPGTGRVNVSSGGGGGNSFQIRLPEPVRRTADAPYRDNRDPKQAARNVDVQYQGINALLEFATGDQTRKFISDEIDRRAQREAGEVIDSYPSVATTSQNDPAADAAYNALSPRAKDFVIQARAASAVSQYQPALRAQIAANPILVAAGTSAEQRAEAMAKATAAARDASGLTALPSYQLVVNADKLAQADGQFRGETYLARTAKEADLAKVGLIKGATRGLFDGFKNLSAAAANDSLGNQPLVVGLRKTIEEIVTTTANNFGPQGQAQVAAGGIFGTFDQLTDAQDKLGFLQALQAVANSEIYGADDKTDIFSIPLGQSGVTIKDKLNQMLPGAEVEADKAIIGRTYIAMEALRAEGKEEEARALGMSQLELLNDPTKVPAFIQNIEKLTSRITPEMQEQMLSNANDIFDRQLNGEDAKDLYKEMIVAEPGTYSADDIRRMFRLADRDNQNNGDALNNPNRRAYQEFEQSRNKQSDEFDVGFYEYLEYTDFKPGKDAFASSGKLKPESDQQLKNERAAFTTAVRDLYYKKRADALTNGEEWDQVKAIQDSIKEVVSKKKQSAGSASTPPSPKEQYTSYATSTLNNLADVASASGGRIDEKRIPASAIAPSTLAVWQQANPGKTFESLSGRQKLNLLAEGIMTFKRYDAASGQYVNYTAEEAKKKAVEMLKQAEQSSASRPRGFTSQALPETVPVKPSDDGTEFVSPAQKATVELLEGAADYIQKDASKETSIPLYEGIKQWFNNGGFGPQAMSYVDGFLNMTLGAAPANAGGLEYGTPEGLAALRQSWSSGQQGLNTGPLPQIAANTPVRYVPNAITTDKHELFVMVGVAEGTRTASGGYTKAYYGHRDPGDGNFNRGTVSGGRGSSASPRMVDRQWMGILTNVQQRMRGPLMAYGLEPGTAGYNRVMFNLIDLTVQSPAAAKDFAGKLAQIRQQGWTVEAIAKARADSFFSPTTGRLDAPGFGNNYQRLFRDQRSRAGVYDYRRRI